MVFQRFISTRCLLLILLAWSVNYGNCQNSRADGLLCVTQDTCESCNSASENCYWCQDIDFHRNSSFPACNLRQNILDAGCPSSKIVSTKKSFETIEEDKSFTDIVGSEDVASTIQIRPQKMTIGLRPKEKKTFKFSYRPTQNFPVDLYYLMDLSWSMRDDQETIVSLGDELPNALKNLTTNFRLGFGSFADKPVMPYSHSEPRKLQNPCARAIRDYKCGPTYAFRHRLPLSRSMEDFVSAVNASEVTANVDAPEATLDALGQVMACRERVGWAGSAHKIVVIATDSKMHSAGDGILGGIVRPYDGRCHMDDIGFYNMSTEFDYPSLQQIYRLIKENKLNVVFAVTEDVYEYYKKIHELIPEYTYVGVLEADSSNIISLIQRGYEDIVSSIRFQHKALQGIQVTYKSNCGSGEIVETSRCDNVKMGQTYEFEVTVSFDEFTESMKQNQQVVISEASIDEQFLIVDLELLGQCDCKESDLFTRTACPGNSHMVCGKCACKKGWTGRLCNCNTNDFDVASERALCLAPGDSVVCSGAGDCFCGSCECDPGLRGEYCQCRHCQIDLDNGMECGGPARGVCVCGTCQCREGWSGSTCGCTTSTARCMVPGGEEVCSGRGDCRCGECQCGSEGALLYTGQYCEDCANCDNPVCALYEQCVREAVQGDRGAEAGGTEACVSPAGTIFLPEFVRDKTPPDDAAVCIFRKSDDEDVCNYPYTYEMQRDWTVKLKIYPKICYPKVNLAYTGGLAFLATLILGGVILGCIWGTIVISDRRAYSLFMAESEKSKQTMYMTDVSQNPLYKSPITEFRNPAHMAEESNVNVPPLTPEENLIS